MLFIQPIFSYSDSQDVAPSGFSPLIGPGYQSLLLQLLKAVKAPFSFSAYLSKTDENLRREKQLEGHSLGPGLASQDPGDTLFPRYWLCTDIFIIFLACRKKKKNKKTTNPAFFQLFQPGKCFQNICYQNQKV